MSLSQQSELPGLRVRRRRRPAPRTGVSPADRAVLVDVMSQRQKRQFRFLMVAWSAGLIVFFLWWFRREHIASVTGFAVTTALLGVILLTPGYFFFFVARMKRFDPHLPIPRGWRVAMVTTRAPSEPFSVVQRTLEAMLAQDYPHDTWLADEDPTEEIYRWCSDHGVLVSTRQGVTDYHRSQWPRRTRCKEGNLAYFYDHFGYEQYDFVVQLDADHVPGDGYLEAMLRPFVDPAVGYVSAPSICSQNTRSSWSSRGRLYAESIMHGPLQAGYSAGFAPLCIGSHYAVRTAALAEIGGLGPELAEDHSTTLMMNAHGWRGIHALDAIAYGEGPPTLGDCITQEFQWSRSLMVILLTILPKYWSRLPRRMRFQFLFTELWYSLFGGSMFVGTALPMVAVLSREPLVKVSYLDFLLHVLPLAALTMAVLRFLKRYGWVRPVDAPVFSWEMALFQLVRWPWVVYGSAMGLVAAVRRRHVEFRVTPKGTQAAPSLDWAILLPYVLIVLFTFLPTVVVGDAGPANGYFYFLILTQVSYVAALFGIVTIHFHENTKAG